MGQAQCREACDAYAQDLDRTGRLCHQRGTQEKSEIPMLVARYTCSDSIGVLLRKNLDVSHREHSKRAAQTRLVAAEERANPGKETIERFLTSDPSRSDAWLLTYIKAFLARDEATMCEVREEVVFHARLVLACAALAKEDGLRTKPFDMFQSNDFSVGHAFALGGSSFALCYDIMANCMAADQVRTVRRALSVATTGRRSWGMELPPRRIQSNWSGYHGDLLVMAAAIEGEEGYDSKLAPLYADLMQNYLSFGFYDSGHSVEDAYAMNVGLREGSLALLAMARRGENLFRHPHYARLWRKWMPLALHPDSSGCIYGGPSGSDLIYCTSVVVAKFVYPQCPTVDFVYRHYMCENGVNYSRLGKMQTRAHCALFALPAQDEAMAGEGVHTPDSALPLTFHCKDRGKVIMRSDWRTQSAVWLTLDSRGDAFFIGHDAPSRGSFVLNAGGRNWGRSPEWKLFQSSTDYSLVSIDGEGQRVKAPSVKLLDCVEGDQGSYTFAAADLTYAYNFEWTTWAKKCDEAKHLSAGWEREPSSPRSFGMTAHWLPDKLYDEPDVAFMGLHQLRRRFNTVRKVTRSVIMVRDSPSPYLILADDCSKGDGARHEYTWSMAVMSDVVLLSFDGTDAVLGETCGGRRLVLRVLTACGGTPVSCDLETYSKENKQKKGADGTCEKVPATRLNLRTAEAVDAHFNLAFFSLEAADEVAPLTFWRDKRHLVVETKSPPSGAPAATQVIEFDENHRGAEETTMRVVESSRAVW